MRYHFVVLSILPNKKGHNAAIQCVTVMMDSRRIISADRDGLLCVWLAESGTLLQTIQGPYRSLAATNNMKFAVSINRKSQYTRFSAHKISEKMETLSHINYE